MTPIEQRFKSELNSYDTLRSECHKRVVKWVYSTEEIWSPYPVRARRVQPGSVVQNKAQALHAWGYDHANQLAVIQDFDYSMRSGVRVPKTGEVMVEYFLRPMGNRVVISRFLRGRLQYVWTITIEHGRTIEMEEFREDVGASRDVFEYEGDYLKRCISFNDKGRAVLETVYDRSGEVVEMYDVRRDGSRRLRGQPVPEGMTVKSLIETVRERLLAAIPKAVAAAKIKEPVYALALAYDGEGNDVLPPILGIGVESERQAWLKEKGKQAKAFVWNPAEWTHYEKSHTQLDDDALDEACDYLNQLLSDKGSDAPAKKLLKEVVAELGKMDWKKRIRTTPDFVVYATDFELRELKKNLKASATPKQFEAFKKAGLI